MQRLSFRLLDNEVDADRVLSTSCIGVFTALLTRGSAPKDGPAVLVLNTLEGDQRLAKKALDLARLESFVDLQILRSPGVLRKARRPDDSVKRIGIEGNARFSLP